MEKNLPLLEYCNLNRASKLLDCEVEDFLHWDEINAISLYFHIPNLTPAIIKINKKYDDLCKNITSNCVWEHGYSRLVVDLHTKLEPQVQDSDYISLSAKVCGLWRICKLSTFGKPITSLPYKNSQAALLSFGEKLLAIIHNPELGISMDDAFKIEPEELIILKDDIRKIRTYSGKSMPSNLKTDIGFSRSHL